MLYAVRVDCVAQPTRKHIVITNIGIRISAPIYVFDCLEITRRNLNFKGKNKQSGVPNNIWVSGVLMIELVIAKDPYPLAEKFKNVGMIVGTQII